MSERYRTGLQIGIVGYRSTIAKLRQMAIRIIKNQFISNLIDDTMNNQNLHSNILIDIAAFKMLQAWRLCAEYLNTRQQPYNLSACSYAQNMQVMNL